MTDAEPIRILIADDHAVVREGLRALIDTEPGMELAGEATDGVEAVDRARSLQPDVILLDLVMPRKGGLEAIGEIKEVNPDARILVLTSFDEDEKVFHAIKSGALGYLLKDASPQELLRAIREVHHGEPSMQPPIAHKVMRELQRTSNLPPTEEPLTAREVEILKWVAQGLSNHYERGSPAWMRPDRSRTSVAYTAETFDTQRTAQRAVFCFRPKSIS